MKQAFKPELKKLPGGPGVYLMYSASSKVIYVGKALNLRKRVSSYWKQLNKQSIKTQALVKQVAKLDFIATTTEAEALILENELIKKYQPQYNVLLRDDKTFQYIRIGLNQPFPEITTVRRVNPADIKSRDPNRPRYFGPYTAGGAVKNTLKLLNSIFPICGKARELNRGSVKAPCLNYHLGRCLGVCVGKASASDYRTVVDEVVKFLNGDTRDTIKQLRTRMERLSQDKRFEEAARLRDRISSLTALFAQQTVSRPKALEQDFLGMLVEGEKMIISRAQVRSGRLLGQQIFVLRAPLGDTESALMSQAILAIYDKVFEDLPREIIVPVMPEGDSALTKWLSGRRGTRVSILVPQKGPNLKLLSIAQRNAAQHSGSLLDVDERLGVKKALVDLKNLLKLKKLERIEAYDISHLGGTHTVGSMVVFKEGKPDKNSYRRFKIKTVPGIDDYAALGEVITRRLSPERRVDQRFAGSLPDAILIDGGKGQLSSVLAHVSAEDQKAIRFFSLAKREEEIFLPKISQSVVLPKNSVALQMLQRLRDEAHRFATSYQTVLKTKQLVGDTEKIVGIGATTRKKLVQRFGSLAAARRATDAELSRVLSEKQVRSFRLN